MKKQISLFCIFVILIILIQPTCPVIGSAAAYTYDAELAFPSYGQEEQTASAVAEISGSGTCVAFRRITASDGKAYVQRRTTVGGSEVDAYTDGLGVLVMYADSVSAYDWPYTGSSENYPHFNGSYNGTYFSTANVFEGGYPSWITMSEMTVDESASPKKVILKGENEFAKVTMAWSIGENEKDPLVSFSAQTKKDGYYSFGLFTSPKGYDKESMKFIQVPYRYTEKGLPDDSYLVSEAYSTASLSQVTTVTGSTVAGKDVTHGIFVDPASVVSNGNTSAKEMRWVRSNENMRYYADDGTAMAVDTADAQSNYGLSIRGKDGNVQPGVFAPIIGTSDCAFRANGTYSFTCRMVSEVSEPAISSWYDSYQRVLTDYLKVRDYRNNYYASMTDTIFNLTDLALDDKYGGWSDDGKAHYNMEGRNVVSDADPLSYMQLYLLTEDKNILSERTVPSMEFILSRSSAMYNAYGRTDGEGTEHGYGSPEHMVNALISNSDTLSTGYTAMGFKDGKEGTDGIGNSSYFGAYQMTMGMMPYYQHLAAVRLNNTYISKANYCGVNNPSEHLWRSKALALSQSGATETASTVLNRAKTHGNWYVDRRVNLNYTADKVAAGANNAPDDNLFVFKDFTPNINSLLELYEETNDQTYLDAAKEAAHRLIATLWATYMSEPSDTYEIDGARADYINKVQKYNFANSMWWHGDKRFRLGEAEDAWKSPMGYLPKWKAEAAGQTETAVPAWTVSRVGLGIEQTTTFGATSGNIIMSTWAPDLLRIAYYTDDELLEAFTRNALVGRFANYPSYYLNEYSTYQQQENFPYVGPDTTQIYYHHIPVMISMLQDFLISQAYSWSDAKIDFPSCRSQGYHYYSTRHYGFAPGNVFNEKDMWLWMKKGLITVDSKQIDWFGARKDGRCAFVFTNASDEEVTTNVTFGDEVSMQTAVNSVTYTSGGAAQTKVIRDKKTTVTVPPKTSVAIAFSANVSAPGYAKMYGTNLTDYSASFAQDSVLNTNDVIGHTVQIAPDSYHAYVYTTYRPSEADGENGLSMAILRYSIGGESWKAVTDTAFPFEFDIPVDDSTKDFKYKVELYDKDKAKVGTSAVCTLSALSYAAPEPIKLVTSATRGTTVSATSNPTISGWGTKNNAEITQTGNCFAFFKVGNDTGNAVDATAIFVLVDKNGAFKRVAKIVKNTVPAANTSSKLMNFSTAVSDPIVLTEADLGCHFAVYLWSGTDTMIPYLDGKYDFSTGKVEN